MSAQRILPALLFFLLSFPLPLVAGSADPAAGFRELEERAAGRLGVYALHTGTGRLVAWRADERFPLCSTFKALLAGTILQQAETDPGLLDRLVRFERDELVTWSPVTEKYVGSGLSVRELCVAAVTHSDNTAANLLLRLVGGPEGLTASMRRLGDRTFRLDRWETALNEALPGDERDTSSPAAMARSLGRLAVEDTLSAHHRGLLVEWLIASRTGEDGLRSGIPAEWIVGYKTGSGAYGTTNCVAVIWSPCGSPILLAVYFTQSNELAPTRPEVLKEAARLALRELGLFRKREAGDRDNGPCR